MKKLAFLLGLIIFFIGCPPVYKNAARIYISRMEWENAKQQILLGIKETPTDFEYYCLLFKVEVATGQMDSAFKSFQTAVKTDSIATFDWILVKEKDNRSSYGQAFLNIARLMHSKQKSADALKYLDYAKTINPDDYEVFLIEGQIYTEMKDPDRANQAFTKVLKIDPENPEAYFLVGIIAFDKKQYDSSVVKFTESIKYFDVKWKKTAKTVFQNLPDIDMSLLYQIADLYNAKKDTMLAELIKVKLGYDQPSAQKRNIEKLMIVTNGISRTHYYLGMSYYYLKNDSMALKNLLKSIEYVPKDLDALFFTGELKIKGSKYQEAISYFDRITKLNKDDLYSWFYLAVCYTQLKEYQKAINIYEGEILTRDPKNIEALTNLAYCYREIGNNKKAYEYLIKAEQLQKEK
ncbi:hypothetical protein A2Y85_05225 [candidate division WOR-3 bacterium RBG_13_43_14]|uniref:Tetratricopeptide repeat protein n=1 Tax=candidate division WOR-3 bacterium RBG_13_43_14 TaxID=1802590 RepID=A0A1F4UEG1_UNCW3|nr:MAG: hypothetical protein A2Y85_05225 [candidate division WOR-3 bacterium RBG_13_43_14]